METTYCWMWGLKQHMNLLQTNDLVAQALLIGEIVNFSVSWSVPNSKQLKKRGPTCLFSGVWSTKREILSLVIPHISTRVCVISYRWGLILSNPFLYIVLFNKSSCYVGCYPSCVSSCSCRECCDLSHVQFKINGVLHVVNTCSTVALPCACSSIISVSDCSPGPFLLLRILTRPSLLLCTFMWYRREALREKSFSHISHLKGFSPVWIRRWLLKWLLWLNSRPHSSHLKGRSPKYKTKELEKVNSLLKCPSHRFISL